jgi:membrane protein
MSASVAFYAAFSLAPMLVIAIAAGSVFFGVDAVQGRLQGGIQTVVGREGAVVVETMLANAWKAGGGGWSGWLSVLAMAVGASATFAELNRALNRIWRVQTPARPVSRMLRVRLMSFGLVVGIGFLIVVLLIADAVIIYGTELVFGQARMAPVLRGIQLGVSFCILWFAFSALLKVLPDIHVRWRHTARGGLAAALLFVFGKELFARYLAYAGVASAFGAAGSLAVLMMWLFFSAAVFFLGAQVAAHSSRRQESTGGR